MKIYKRMQSKIALIQFDKCMPEKCEGGSCVAAKAWNHKLIIQEAPGEIPMMNPSLCAVVAAIACVPAR